MNHDYFEERTNAIIDVLDAISLGENIAYNYPTAESAMKAWLNSREHKANILVNYKHFGISVTIDPETGSTYYTNIFMRK